LIAGLTVLAVIVLYQLWPTARLYVVFRQTTCTIQAKQIVSQTRPKGPGTITLFRPQFTFTYVVNGRSYTHVGYTTSDFEEPYAPIYTQFVLDRFRVGGSYRCWYSRQDPEEATLSRVPGIHFWLWLIVGVGIGLTLIRMFVVWSISQRTRERSIEGYHTHTDL